MSKAADFFTANVLLRRLIGRARWASTRWSELAAETDV
jgi:hypothetical protein